MTAGVALSVKSGLGVSPISSVPYTMTCVFDSSMVFFSLLVCLIVLRSLGSVGIGTVGAAILVGSELALINRTFRPSSASLPAEATIRRNE